MKVNSNQKRVREQDGAETHVASNKRTTRSELPKYDAYLKGLKDTYEKKLKDDPEAAKNDLGKGESTGVRLGLDYPTRKSAYDASVARCLHAKAPRQLGPYPDVPGDKIPLGISGGTLKPHDDSDEDFGNFF